LRKINIFQKDNALLKIGLFLTFIANSITLCSLTESIARTTLSLAANFYLRTPITLMSLEEAQDYLTNGIQLRKIKAESISLTFLAKKTLINVLLQDNKSLTLDALTRPAAERYVILYNPPAHQDLKIYWYHEPSVFFDGVYTFRDAYYRGLEATTLCSFVKKLHLISTTIMDYYQERQFAPNSGYFYDPLKQVCYTLALDLRQDQKLHSKHNSSGHQFR
jgi:multisubunit Na+/H+ antiporter MnhG subunit